MRTGVWLVGARGSVAITSMVGALALRAGLAEPTGCVTELPELRSAGPARLRRPGLRRARRGHHPAGEEGRGARRRRGLPGRLVAAARATSWPRSRRTCGRCPTGGTQAEAAALIAADLTDFRERHGLDRVVVVNVSSTEPAARAAPRARRPRRALRRRAARHRRRCCRPARSYAYAAFTRRLPLRRLHPVHRRPAARAAPSWPRERGLPYAGHDGKTGETLVKSVLAPMFAMRNLARALLVRGQPARRRRRRQPRRPGAPTRPRRPASSGCSAETLGYVPQGEHPHRLRARTSATSRPPGT